MIRLVAPYLPIGMSNMLGAVGKNGNNTKEEDSPGNPNKTINAEINQEVFIIVTKFFFLK